MLSTVWDLSNVFVSSHLHSSGVLGETCLYERNMAYRNYEANKYNFLYSEVNILEQPG